MLRSSPARSRSVCLFFYCSGHHRDLHSFPTRRSSDLYLLEHRLHGSGAAELRDPTAPDAALDRKSTRLNSSHEWSSYAVFCLKKKTHGGFIGRMNAELAACGLASSAPPTRHKVFVSGS